MLCEGAEKLWQSGETWVLVWIFPVGLFVYPPLSPRPFTPTGVKGSLNSQFDFFVPDRGVAERGGGAGMFAQIGERGGRS